MRSSRDRFSFSFLTAISLFLSLAGGLFLTPSSAYAVGTIRYVSVNGSDSGSCVSSPCRTLYYGISQMSGGDTLIVGNGTYTIQQSTRNVIPSGNAGPDGIPRTSDDVYTTIQAESDFGVTLDGSQFVSDYDCVLYLWGKSFVKLQGFRVKGNPRSATPICVTASDHVKLIRNGASGGGTDANNISIGIGPGSSYVLLEENYSYSGSRYEFLIYQSDHVVARRNVARNDNYVGPWQAAAFVSYDSANTVWQNNIAIDSDTPCCDSPTHGVRLWAGFWNENFEGEFPDTTQEFHGNIVLNYKGIYAANYDPKISASRIIDNDIYWGGSTGYVGDQGVGLPISMLSIKNITSGGNSEAGISIGSNFAHSVKNSIFANNRLYGEADFTNGNFNAYSGNGNNFGMSYGGSHTPSPGSNDISNQNIVGNILKYLPRGPESGSALANGGENGERIGAQVIWRYGLEGTLWGEPGWNVLRSSQHGYGRPQDKLWPFPNEAFIKADFASYNGPGLPGARGFASSGNGLYGGPKTLTSYIWEYLGYPCPSDVCGGTQQFTPCDLNQSASTDIADIQLCVNQAIGISSCVSSSQYGSGDINSDGQCDVVDVQRTVVNALGGQCNTM